MYKNLKRPSKEQLIQVLKNNTNIQTALYFNASRETIQRWRKFYGLSEQFIKVGVFDLSRDQMERLLGNLLGDGTLSKISGRVKNSRFSFKQAKIRSEYVEGRHSDFRQIARPIRIELSKKAAKIDGQWTHKINRDGFYESVQFYTYAHEFFTELESKWYLRHDGKYVFNELGTRIKIVPKDLELTWQMVAYWFADDGQHRVSRREINLATNGFRLNDIEFLVGKLSILGIQSTIQKTGVIYIKSVSYDAFITNITPFLTDFECLQYKLGKCH